MKFLEKIISDLLDKTNDLSSYTIVLPGKRPIVFIKKILKENNYFGFLPQFITIEDLISEISEKQPLQGIALWLFAYQVYLQTPMLSKDDFSEFLKWFPTLQKDWDDMLKFAGDDCEVLDYMVSDENIKEWASSLGEKDAETPRQKFLDFWKNMNEFLPNLKSKLIEKNYATSGIIHQIAKEKIKKFAENTVRNFVFCGFNALTPTEELLLKNLLQLDKAIAYFQGDEYYINDKRQEAGQFLREYKNWKEFNGSRDFNWIENDFQKDKQICIYEVTGNISQTKLIPEILQKNGLKNENDYSETAIVLLDENLLPAVLDAVADVPKVNITMGFPIKNLSFSIAIKHIFNFQKKLEKKADSYYYKDVLAILEELPQNDEYLQIITEFKNFIEQKNIIYISKKLLYEQLHFLPFYPIFEKQNNSIEFLELLISICQDFKHLEINPIQYENISHFETTFKVILHQIQPYSFDIKMDTLEVMMQQIVNSETIDFQGEPLEGLQIMGLLESRLLNFKNIILVSTNEGKLPLGNSQNTLIPFHVRKLFNMHTFLENDSIYAYHFYRFLQGASQIHLLYNGINSGVNSGEKSRFITQLELEDKHHQLEFFVIDNNSEPITVQPIEIRKTQFVMERLQEWKTRVSVSSLNSYNYNPIQFYFQYVLRLYDKNEIEEELSNRTFGSLVHIALELIYQKFLGKYLLPNDLELSEKEIEEILRLAFEKMDYQKEYFERGINYLHKKIAIRTIQQIISFDKELVKNGHQLKILELEKKFENIDFEISESETIQLKGYIDRIDELDGNIRIIDYKTGKLSGKSISVTEKNIENLFFNENKKQALQLCIYQYVMEQLSEYKNKILIPGIWSFAEISKGVNELEIKDRNLEDALLSIKNLILEILNPEIPFVEIKRIKFNEI